MKKIFSLIVTFLVMQACLAEEVKNEAVENAEVVLATFNDKGVLEPIGEPVTVNPDGTFDADLPEGFPDYKPVFLVAQDPNGDGIPQISALTEGGDENVTIDPASTAIANTFVSFISSGKASDPASTDLGQVKEFFGTVGKALEGVPAADTAADSVDRMAQALSLKPDTFLEAVKDSFNVDPEEMIKVASLIDQAASPEGYNPLAGTKPPELPSEIPPGSTAPGLLPPDLVAKMAPKGFDFNKTFGDQVPPPGGFQFLDASGKPAPIPAGTFMMPSVTANANVKFPENAMFPPGVTVPSGFKMPPNATLSPGTVLAEGFVPPSGLSIPPGIVAPEGFNAAQFGAKQLTEFTPPSGFMPPPGFAILDKAGGVGIPPGTTFPSGVKVPDGALQMPPPTGFDASKMPPPPKGFEAASSSQVPSMPTGYVFVAGSSLPAGFNPQSFGMQPPPGFQEKMPPPPVDMAQFKGDKFVPFDPFGGTFKPPVDGQTPFVPANIAAGGFDPNSAFTPVPPPAGQGPNGNPNGGQGPANPGQGGDKGGANPPASGQGPNGNPNGGQGPANPGQGGDKGGANPPVSGQGPNGNPNGGQGPANPGQGGDKGGSNPPASGGSNPPASGGSNPPASGGSNPPASGGSNPPASGGSNPPASGGSNPPASGGSNPAPSAPPPTNSAPPPPPPTNSAPPPPPPQARRKFSVISSSANNTKAISVLGAQSVKAGTRLDLTVTSKAKARKVTASQGVYALTKPKAGATSTKLALVIDPSVSSSSIKVNVASIDNSVEITDLTLEKDATQLITQLNGSKIEMTTAGTDITDLGISSVTGYLLAPVTSAMSLKSAIPVKGTVEEGTDGQIVSFTKPKKALADGVYTIVFQNGEEVYYGKLTIGTLKTRKITGRVLAPGGKL